MTLKMLEIRSDDKKSHVIGVYDSRAKAKAAAEAYIKKNGGPWSFWEDFHWTMKTQFHSYDITVRNVMLNETRSSEVDDYDFGFDRNPS